MVRPSSVVLLISSGLTLALWPPAPGSVSQDGICGGSRAITCINSKFGNCCAYNRCGRTESYCNSRSGCDPRYGICALPSSSIRTLQTTTRTSSIPSSSAVAPASSPVLSSIVAISLPTSSPVSIPSSTKPSSTPSPSPSKSSQTCANLPLPYSPAPGSKCFTLIAQGTALLAGKNASVIPQGGSVLFGERYLPTAIFVLDGELARVVSRNGNGYALMEKHTNNSTLAAVPMDATRQEYWPLTCRESVASEGMLELCRFSGLCGLFGSDTGKDLLPDRLMTVKVGMKTDLFPLKVEALMKEVDCEERCKL